MDPFQRHGNPTITTTKCLFTNMTQHDVTCDVTNRIDIDRYFQLMKEEMSRLEVDDTSRNSREFRRSWSGSRTERRKRKERDPKKRLSCSDADDVSERYKRQFKRFDENFNQGRDIDRESRLNDVDNPGSFRFIDPNLHSDNKKCSPKRNRRRSFKRSASLNSDFGQRLTAKSSIESLDLFYENPIVRNTDSFQGLEEKEKENTSFTAEDSHSDNESTVDESRTSREPCKSVRSMRRWKSLDACVYADVNTDDDFNYINLNVFEKTIESNSVSGMDDSQKNLVDTQSRSTEGKEQTNEQSEQKIESRAHKYSFDKYEGKIPLLNVPKSEDARHRSYSWSDNFKSRHRESAHIHRRLVRKSKSIDDGEISREKKLDRLLSSDDNQDEQPVTLRLSCSPEHKKRSRSREKKVRKTSINTKIVEDVISEQDCENNEENSRDVKEDINSYVTGSKLPLNNDICENDEDIKTSGLSSSL